MHWSRFALVSLLVACSSAAGPTVDPAAGIADGCDPLVPEQCGFPLPNDFWRSADGHVNFGATTLPVNNATNKQIDPATWNKHDGFSPGQELVTFLPRATALGLPGQDNMALSITTGSPTIVIDTSTGELVPHFAEIDRSTFHDDDQSFLIHPALRLKDATRYVVAIRHIKDADGKSLPAGAAFAALRDKTASKLLDARRSHFEDIFSVLDKKGIARADLQIAWDFTTASQKTNVGDMLSMRDQALAVVGDQGPAYTITKIEDAPNQWLSKIVTGMMTVPLYLNQPGPGPTTTISRGPDGLPKQNGTAQYEFVMLIPKTIPPSGQLGILQNGHGLLGGKREGVNGYFAQICEQYGYVGFAVDWVGMASEDNQTLVDASATDFPSFDRAVDRQHQGFINALLAMRMMKGRMTSEPLLQQNGKSIIDPKLAFYRGDSQGGIFGATYMAISTDVTRGLLGETGAPYTLLLDRSVDFSGFKFLLKGSYPRGMDLRMIFALMQMSWDRTEPDGYLPYIRQNMLPKTPAHEVLLHIAIGDHQVSPLGAHFIARTIGAKNMKPVNRSIWGIEETDAPFTGSAIVEFDFGLNAPIVNIPPSGPDYGKDPHDDVRVLPNAMDQANHFLRTGEVKAYCSGPCKGT